MAEIGSKPSAAQPGKRRGFLRFVIWGLGVFIVLVVVAYFVGTSAAFLKGVILPKAGKTLNAEITVSDASISPFSEVYLKDLKLKPAGQEALFTAANVRLRYKLMDIIRGKIDVDEITVSSPSITLSENADGSSNLDPIMNSQKSGTTAAKPPEKKSSTPLQLDLKKFALTDGEVRYIKIHTNGSRDTVELSHINFSAANLKNGQAGKLSIDADAKIASNPPGGDSGTLDSKIKTAFDIALGADLMPSSIQGNTHFGIAGATGSYAETSGLAADLDCNVTPTEVKQVALRFSKDGSSLGEVRVSGPLDLAKTEGKLSVLVSSIDKKLLNIAGASAGMDFGTTVISSTNQIELAKGGSVIVAMGRVTVDKLQVTFEKQKTPTLDFSARYNVTVDRGASDATLREFALDGVENGRQMLHGELTSPMSVSWGKADVQAGDSALNLVVTSLNLADWKPFLRRKVSSGVVSAKAQLLSQQAGKLLTFDLGGQVDNLTAKIGSGRSNRISQAGVTLAVKGKANDLEKFDLSEFSLALKHQNQPVLTVSGAGNYDKTSNAADLQLTANSKLPNLLNILPQPDVSFTSGSLDLKAKVLQQKDTVSLTGNLAVSDLTGAVGKNNFHSFQTAMDLDVAKTPDQILIHRVNGKLSEAGQGGGGFDLSGTIGTNNAIQVTAKLADFNQNGLRPFLEPLLTGGKQLVSVAINGTADARVTPQGDSAIKADIKVTNLVVKDPAMPALATPLEAGLQVDATVQKQMVVDMRQCALTLTPTDRAKNQLQLSGKIDMSQTNGLLGSLKLAAESLDMTRYYDLFAAPAQTQAAPAAPNAPSDAKASAPSASGAGLDKEPDAVHLPIRSFTADVNIGKFYLREVEITNLQTSAKIETSHLVLNPFKLVLNGAPVDASVDLDLGVPGYKYDTAFNLQAVPLTPLVNSFQPDRKGQIGGTLTAHAKVTGAGVTGPNLKKNLVGNFDVNSTNLNFAIDQVKQPVIKLIINVVGFVPELIKNPVTGVSDLLGGVTGKSGGLAGELRKAPIQSINARGMAGSGVVQLQQAAVINSAFRADATGAVQIAEILTNSPINLPVTISLGKDIATRFSLGSSDTNAAYTKLPDFLLIEGTVGNPKPNKTKLLVLGATAAGSLVKAVTGNEAVGGLIQSAGALLGGKSTTPAQGEQGKSTNKSAVNQLLNGLLKPKK